MRKHTWLLPLAAVLAGGVCFLGVVRARDDTDKEEQAKIEAAVKAAPDVQKLAAAAAPPAAGLPQQAAAIFKKYPDDMLSIMWQMKPRGKGGLGVGPTPGAYVNDAIELQLLELGGKKPTPAAVIKQHGPDWQSMAQVIKGISAVAPSYVKKYTKTPDEAKAWNGLAGDMDKGADDLIAAIKAGNAANFKKAVDNLNHSCNDCHTKFRDN